MEIDYELLELINEYDIDPEKDDDFMKVISVAKRMEISEHDLRLALDFILMARQREEDAKINNGLHLNLPLEKVK